jgi:hypothetical protein
MLEQSCVQVAKQLNGQSFDAVKIETISPSKSPQIAGLGIVNQEGTHALYLVEKDDKQEQSSVTFKPDALPDWLTQARAGKSGYYPLVPDPSTEKLTIVYAMPRYKSGSSEIIGVIFATQSLEHLRHILSTLYVGKESYWFITDAQSKILIHPLIHLMGNSLDTIAPHAQEFPLTYQNEITGHASWLLVLALPTGVLAASTAGYSAYLFGQAEGRDFWQSPLLLPHLLIAALIGGSASLLLVDAVTGAQLGARADFAVVLGAALALNAIMLLAELGGRHSSLDAGRAAKLITRGHFATRFWCGVIAGGTLLPIALIAIGPAAAVPGAILALVGLWIWEDTWIRAGQSIPLS